MGRNRKGDKGTTTPLPRRDEAEAGVPKLPDTQMRLGTTKSWEWGCGLARSLKPDGGEIQLSSRTNVCIQTAEGPSEGYKGGIVLYEEGFPASQAGCRFSSHSVKASSDFGLCACVGLEVMQYRLVLCRSLQHLSRGRKYQARSTMSTLHPLLP